MIETYNMMKVTGKGFRLIHDDKKVLTLVEGTDGDQTITRHKVEEFPTENEVLDRIIELKLEYTPDDIGEI